MAAALAKLFATAVAGLAIAGSAVAQPTIVVASTTSTEQSGLFAHLLPQFTRATGIGVKVVALGTGQAIDIARRGDADVLFVHDPSAEEKFVADGFAARRYAVMYNDFVLVGPRSDPAGVRGGDIASGLRRVAQGNASFISRGDRSGTHAAELRYWEAAGLSHGGSGYRSCGCGMGQALNIGSAASAYVLTDRGSWLAFRNRGELAVLVEGDRRLMNQYGAMVVSGSKHPHVQAGEAQRFVDWLVSAAGQAAIAGFRVGGHQLFFPNAAAP